MNNADTQYLDLARPLPTLKIKRQVTIIDDFVYEDFELVGYNRILNFESDK